MNKDVIKVPKGIRYISEWKDIENYLPQDEPFVMNKTITGCGFTEYCITNSQPTILCSPRLILLENKEEQHQDMENLLYLRNEFDSFEEYDKDINKDDLKFDKVDKLIGERKLKAEAYTEYFKEKIKDHLNKCNAKGLPPKFLVTYDSFRRVKEALGEKCIKSFIIVVDEFQSIFCDSRFKSDTENTFLQNIKDLKKVCYLSATPMVDKYLDMLDEFKDLKYLELDWRSEDLNRVIQPYITTKQCKSILTEVFRVIESYKSGNFEKLARRRDDGLIEEVYSTEAVIYINSVKNICDIIRKCDLKLDETNILCADTEENEKRIREAFNKGKSKSEKISIKTKCIGTVPKENDPHKMFTLCTRTVYLGADFYSKCARSFIFSDADIDCLSVDITLDLPQILGRQRLDMNPWKNRAELYFKINTKEKSQEEFNKYIQDKFKRTEEILRNYTSAINKHVMAEDYLYLAKSRKYKKDYVAVDEHAGSDLKPVFNNLVMISEIRAFEIQQVDYKDRFSVFSAINDQVSDKIDDITEYIVTFNNLKNSFDKLKYLCSLDNNILQNCSTQLPEKYYNYIQVLGISRIKANGYNITDIQKEYEKKIKNQFVDIRSAILSEFSIGEKITRAEIKERLKKLYSKIGYDKVAKALDLQDYFELKIVDIPNKITGKRDKGFEILKQKT